MDTFQIIGYEVISCSIFNRIICLFMTKISQYFKRAYIFIFLCAKQFHRDKDHAEALLLAELELANHLHLECFATREKKILEQLPGTQFSM